MVDCRACTTQVRIMTISMSTTSFSLMVAMSMLIACTGFQGKGRMVFLLMPHLLFFILVDIPKQGIQGMLPYIRTMVGSPLLGILTWVCRRLAFPITILRVYHRMPGLKIVGILIWIQPVRAQMVPPRRPICFSRSGRWYLAKMVFQDCQRKVQFLH